MNRSYKNVKPKIHRVYSVDDVLSLYGICRNTLSNWERFGLRSTGGKGPRLYRGAELKRFHDARKLRVKGELKLGEFKCLGCGAAVCPHSARHCLAALGDRLCRSKEEEKAWSLNLGHEKVATTEAHYGKMTDENRRAVMLELHRGTRCWTPAFMRSAGIVHIRVLKLISSQVAPRTSPERAAVNIRNKRACRPTL